MSFSLTTPQFKAQTKTVTRRLGWVFLKPGDHVLGVEKAMGLKKGEKHVVLGEIEILGVRQERLDEITAADCVAEGFPLLPPDGFVTMFCMANGCVPFAVVTRIEFRYVEPVK